CNIKKILIIDWDYHHGNGTQDFFYADPSVLFFSTHNWNAYPGTGDPSLTGTGAAVGLNINAHLDPGATDDDMIRAWDTRLIDKVQLFKPEFILISAGFDSRIDDILGSLKITDACFSRITRTAMTIADAYCKGRVVSLLEGGYNVTGTADGVAAHVGTLTRGGLDSTIIPQSKKQLYSIRAGVLHIPDAGAQIITSITIQNAKGVTLQRIEPPLKTGAYRIDLSMLCKASGRYTVSIATRNGRTEILTYNHVQ
ncbi:MAG: histone deacetylase, partial [Chitinivibrionales bacterium]|nr:histone deacetylase [Chitinivibrionales bacterium]